MGFSLKIPTRRNFIINVQIVLVCFMWLAISMFNFPTVIAYITDILLGVSLFFALKKIQSEVKRAKSGGLYNIILIIIVSTLIGAIINGVSPLMYLWGFRNNMRFYLFFIVCIVLLREKDIYGMIKMLKIFFWINVLVCTYQYFILHLFGDYIGGIFGIIKGGNGYLNMFLMIIWAIILGEYSEKKVGLIKLFVVALGCAYVAYVAELKVVYIEMIIMGGVCFIIMKPSLKTLGLIICLIFGSIVVVRILMSVSPESLDVIFDAQSRTRYLAGNGYTNSGDLNRFTALSSINEMFFKDSFIGNLLGFGMGSCDTSSYSFLQSDFFVKYEYLHYRWFSHAWIYLEQGLLGILSVFSFFISIIVLLIKNKKHVVMKEWRVSVIIISVFAMINIIYNCTLQTEASYLLAFICSIPFVSIKEKRSKNSVLKSSQLKKKRLKIVF